MYCNLKVCYKIINLLFVLVYLNCLEPYVTSIIMGQQIKKEHKIEKLITMNSACGYLSYNEHNSWSLGVYDTAYFKSTTTYARGHKHN